MKNQMRGAIIARAVIPARIQRRLLKLSFILTFSLHLSKTGENINRLRPFLLLCLHGAVPILLIMLQGTSGQSSIF